jgi:hypothetical protein
MVGSLRPATGGLEIRRYKQPDNKRCLYLWIS